MHPVSLPSTHRNMQTKINIHINRCRQVNTERPERRETSKNTDGLRLNTDTRGSDGERKQCKTGRDNKHQQERTLVHAQIYIINGLVSVSAVSAAGALAAPTASCPVLREQTRQEVMPKRHRRSARACLPRLINYDFQLRLSFLLVDGEPGRSSRWRMEPRQARGSIC